MWSKNGMPVDADAAPAAVDLERRARSVVSFVSRCCSRRLGDISAGDLLRATRASAARNASFSSGRADGDPQAARRAGASARSRARARRGRPGAPTARGRRRRTRNSRKFAPDGNTVMPSTAASCAATRSRSATSARDAVVHLGAELEREPCRRSGWRREVVRQHDLLELLDHPRRRDREAEPQRGHRPHLRVRAHDDQRAVVVARARARSSGANSP